MGKMYDKLRKLNNNKSERTLKSFYWGYNADKGADGYEFTNLHAVNQLGLSEKDAQSLGDMLKKASTDQWQGVMREDPTYLEGLTKEQFINEEWDRLHLVIEELRPMPGKQILMEQVIKLTMIACCAISTLVAAGRIPQNKWNGDAFMESIEPGDFLKELA